jgi:hypothetical protein
MKNGDLPHKNDDSMGFYGNSSGFIVGIPKLCEFFFGMLMYVVCL